MIGLKTVGDAERLKTKLKASLSGPSVGHVQSATLFLEHMCWQTYS